MSGKLPMYADLFELSEDERIDTIGHMVTEHGKTIGFVVETTAKADRYIKKLKKKYPTVTVLDQGPGPVKNTILVRVGPQ